MRSSALRTTRWKPGSRLMSWPSACRPRRRTPMSESGTGRAHNRRGFTMFLAGGGVKPGFIFGRTDEVGLYAVENKVHLHDIHATILHLLGLDHEQLTFPHNGRDERLTGTDGEVIRGILA